MSARFREGANAPTLQQKEKTMWKKRVLAILTAAAMAGSAIQPAMAQNYGRDYGNGYQNGYNDPYANNPYDNGRYNSDRDRYEQQRDQYERDRYNYDRNNANRAARFDRTEYMRECERQKSGNTAGGAIVGALAGGLLGNAISRGPQRGAGTAVGAILGGVVGGSIGNNSLNCEDRSYEIDTYYSGFEAGRPHARYDWRSPRSDAYGYLEVQDYYQDRAGYRCANYTQQIYVHGRPELARGVACRQPDGTWRMS
jgi:surface antigen